jgi:hypothetical protein
MICTTASSVSSPLRLLPKHRIFSRNRTQFLNIAIDCMSFLSFYFFVIEALIASGAPLA